MASENSNQWTQGNVFQDINALRKIEDPEEEAQQKEFEKFNDSIWAAIAKNKIQEAATMTVIVINALFLGYDTDYSAGYDVLTMDQVTRMADGKVRPDGLYDKDMPAGFPIFENFFCVYFTLEVIIRYLAFKRKMDCLFDGWMVFDSTLVAIMILETWILPFLGDSDIPIDFAILRLLRLLRITRMGKLMRFFPELQIIVKGMLAAVRSVSVTLGMLILIWYIFAILFTDQYHQGKVDDADVGDCDADPICIRDGIEQASARVFFGSIPKSMRNLIVMGTILDDITACTNAIRAQSNSFPMLMVFFVFVLISSFTMLNMLIGILCEVVTATSDGEKAARTEASVKEAIRSVFGTLDVDHNGTISKKEFESMAHDEMVIKALSKLQVESKHFDMFSELMFQPRDDGSPAPALTLDNVISVITRLRPGSKVGALDFAAFQQNCFKNHREIKLQVSKIDKMMSKVIHYNEADENGDNAKKDESKQLTVTDLDPFQTEDILKEVHRRQKYGGLHLSHQAAGEVEALMMQFSSLYAPDDETLQYDGEAWSKETYTC